MFPRSTLMATQRMNLTYLTLLDIWLVFKITITITVTNIITIRYIVNLVLISVVLLLIIVVAVNILKSILKCT